MMMIFEPQSDSKPRDHLFTDLAEHNKNIQRVLQ